MKQLFVIALALFGLGGCTGGGAEHACDLLTVDDVEELLGVPANGGYEDTDRSHGTYCEWRSEDSDDGHDASNAGGDGPIPYFVSVESERGPEAVKSFRSGIPKPGTSGTGGRLRGLGDDAYFEPGGGVQVRVDDQVFSTYVGGNDDHPLSDSERRRIARQAAEVIADRLD